MLKRLAHWLRDIPVADEDTRESMVVLQGITLVLMMLLAGSFVVNKALLGMEDSATWQYTYIFLLCGAVLSLWMMRRGRERLALNSLLGTFVLGIAALILPNGFRNTLSTTYLFVFATTLLAGILAPRRVLIATLVSVNSLLIVGAQLELWGLIPMAANPAVWDAAQGRALQTALVLSAIGVFLHYFNRRLREALMRSHQRAQALELEIAERQSATEALRESEHRYRDLFDNASDLIQSVSVDGRFLYVNQAWRDTLGYNPEQVAQLSLFDIIHPNSLAHCQTIFQEIVSGARTNVMLEAVFVARDGRKIVVEGNTNSSFVEGRMVSTRGIFRNVTERRATEAALRKQQEMVEALRSAAAALNQTLDLDEVLDRLLDAATRVVPHEAADVMLVESGVARGVRFRHVSAPELEVAGVCLPVAETATLRQMAETGEPCVVADTADFTEWVDVPEQRWVRSYLGAPIQHKGRLIGFLNFTSRSPGFYSFEHAQLAQAFVNQAAIAIENARLYTRARELAVEAQAANRLKSDILANTSHELKTPLTAIQGALNLVVNDLCDSPAEQRRWAEVAYTASEKLLAMINALLEVARLEADRVMLTPGPVEMVWLLREVEGLIRPRAEAQQLSLRLDLEIPNVTIRADRDRVRQVLLNLLDNALKFTAAGEIALTLRASDTDVEVSVRDTGVGFAEGDAPRFFEPFTQADSSTTRRYGGSGLGLYIAQRLTQLMDGTLQLTSPGEGQGATATVTFPILQPIEVVNSGALAPR